MNFQRFPAPETRVKMRRMAMGATTGSTRTPPRVPSLPRRLAAAAGALCRLAIEPRMEWVSDLTDALCVPAMARMAERLQNDLEGRRLLAERPRLDSNHVDFEALAKLPDGTLGREFVRFLAEHGITPDSFREPVDYFEDVPAYVTLRLRQTHDLWHLLTGYPPTTCGELVLSAFIFAQVGAPSSLLVALLGPFRYGLGQTGLKRQIFGAYRRGRATSRLTSFFWEEHWAIPLVRVRELVACPAA
jgi:ubiquinone biosynthesis protein COQ4